ncbi:MAG: tetratricopeptide repeat protein [Deltaproteobacteria bacterium]|nr:tetratricopeptide repeat protein [Deltaproteobacteria bacterium]
MLQVNREIQPLEPDIVAAAFVVDVLSQVPEIAREIIWLALNEDINGGMQRLSRLSYDAEVVLGLHQYRLSRWLAEAVNDNLERARTLEPLVSKELPIGLLDVAIATWQALLPATEKQSEKARILNNLSGHLSSAGDKNAAIAACLRAVEIYERLAGTNPEAFEPDLASSLNNLGNRYSELGKRKKALDACLRAVEIYERLAGTNPEAFEPDLAMSYGALGNTYRTFDEHKKSATAFRRGISTLKRLFLLNPEAFGSLMIVLVRDYHETSEEIRATPDMPLLSEILAIL